MVTTERGKRDNSGGLCKAASCKENEGGNTHGNAVGVFLADALGLGLALLKGMLVLELGTHLDGG
jgi:hypothetical protein